MENTAVILCRDTEFSRLLLRHTEPLCPVVERDELPDNCRFAVIDLDSFFNVTAVPYPAILFSRKPLSPSFGTFLCRPFLLSEYEARVAELIGEQEKLLRRFILSDDLHTITVNGKCITLSKTEARLLAVLARTPNTAVSREALENEVFAGRANGALNVYICYLRKKLECDGIRRLFATRNGGYTFSPDGVRRRDDECSI